MSLRWRLIWSYTMIVILCLSVAAISVSILLQGYKDENATERLNDMTLPIFVQARSLLLREASVDEVFTNMQKQSDETGIYIYLVDREGTVLRQVSPYGAEPFELEQMPQQVISKDLAKRDSGKYRIDRTTFVFTTYPLQSPAQDIIRPRTQIDISALVLAMPHEGFIAMLVDIAPVFLWSGLISLVVSIIVAILLARSVYRPIRQITQATEGMAQGQYDQEIPLNGPEEIKGLARSFNQMAVQVRLSQERLRAFLADVSHELRTPLTSIRGFAQAIVDGTAENERSRQRSAQIIEDESKRVIRLVNELLELSKIESGQIEMQREIVSVAELIDHCCEVFSMRAQEQGVKLTVDTESLPAITGDVDRLEQVISNLLDNALKHTPSGEEITVSGRQINENMVEIIVLDSGPGISPQELPHVFSRFYKSEESKPGAGLGLAIAREIVRAHGGSIEGRNAAGKGAEFIIRLPIK